MNGHGLVRPGRLQNLSPLGGARGDVMTRHWCDQAEIMEIYRRSGAPRGCYGWVWPGATRQIAESITTQPFNCRSMSLLDAKEVATYISVI